MSRWLLLALLAVYAGLSWSVGFDRLAAQSPELARLVPAPFRAYAHESLANSAALDEDGASTLLAAHAAVEANPVGTHSTALLGVGRLLEGDALGAEAAFRVAAQLGWRSLPTQLYWYEYALSVGDHIVAAERVDAILRMSPGFARFDELLAPLEASLEGRNALATRLAVGPSWRNRYFAPAIDAASEHIQRRIEVAVAYTELSGPQCETFADLAFRAIQNGEVQAARQLVDASCAGDVRLGGLIDPDFIRFQRNEEWGLGWRAERSGETSVSARTDADDSVSVVVGNTSSISQPLLSQILVLEPGTYQLRAFDPDGSPITSDRLSAVIACDTAMPRPTVGLDLRNGAQLFAVDDCAVQTLTLWLGPGGEPLHIARVALDRQP